MSRISKKILLGIVLIIVTLSLILYCFVKLESDECIEIGWPLVFYNLTFAKYNQDADYNNFNIVYFLVDIIVYYVVYVMLKRCKKLFVK